MRITRTVRTLLFLSLLSPVFLSAQTPNLIIAVGDDRTSGTGGGTAYLSYVSLSGWTKNTYGTTSATCTSLQSSTPGLSDHTPASVRRVAVIWCDQSATATPATSHTALRTLAGQYQTVGYAVIVITKPSQSGTCFGSVTCDSWKNSYNALIREFWTEYADNMVDLGRNTNVGDDGDSANGTYFDGDGFHLTNTGYQSVVAPLVSEAVSGLGGQTWARSGSGGGWFTSWDTDGSGCARILSVRSHNLSVGNYVFLDGAIGTDSGNVRNHASNINGVRIVRAVPDSTHFTLNDLSGSCLTPNDTYLASGSGGHNTAQWFGRVVPTSLPAGPSGGFMSGWSGKTSRMIAASTWPHGGLFSLVVAAGSSPRTATATFDYKPEAVVGGYVGVFNTTGDGNLNGTHQITAATDYTYSFTTTATAGTYTYNNACGPSSGDPNTIGGTENCVVLSLIAHTQNPEWNRVLAYTNFSSPADYKHRWDGGTNFDSAYFWNEFQFYTDYAAYRALIDRTNQPAVDALVYFLSKPERIAGVSWAAFYGSDNGGSNPMGHYWSGNHAFAKAYTIGDSFGYLTDAQRSHYLDSIFNDLNDPDPDNQCTVQQPSLMTVATGSAQSGGSGTTIVLAAGSSATNDFYNNEIIRFKIGGEWFFGRVSAYNGTTKVASATAITKVAEDISEYNVGFSQNHSAVGSWTTPTAGTAYTILATISISGTTVTGYGTTFQTSFDAGDAFLPGRYWKYQAYPANSWYVPSEPSSETSMTTTDAGQSQTYYDLDADLGYIQPIWIIKQWDQSSKHCGYWWRFNLILDSPGSNQVVWPPTGGRDSVHTYHYDIPALGQQGGGNITIVEQTAGASAGDDPRASFKLTRMQTYDADYIIRFGMMYMGLPFDSTHYGNLAEAPSFSLNVLVNHNLFPHIFTQSRIDPFLQSLQELRIWQLKNDKASENPSLARYHSWVYGANNAGDVYIEEGSNSGLSAGYKADFRGILNHTNEWSRYLNYLQSELSLASSGGDSYVRFPFYNPNISPLDYHSQPKQWLMVPSQAQIDACVELGGQPGTGELGCQWRPGHAWFSRTDWSSRTATNVFYQARSCCFGYDNRSAGLLRIAKVGEFIGTDGLPPGESPSNQGEDYGVHGDMPYFNETLTIGVPSGQFPGSESRITRWAKQNAGSGDYRYGDSTNSCYVYSMSDSKGTYYIQPTRVNEEIIHFKCGSAEIVMQHDDVDAGASQAAGVRTNVHYYQNGESGNPNGSGPNLYDEGTTHCSTASCSNATTNVTVGGTETIISEQDGAASDSTGPAREYALLTKFFSPDTISLKWDGTYTDGYGHTNRVRVCSGSSCGSAAQTLEDVIVHKVTTLGDTTLTASSIKSDTDWYGVQAEDKVGMFGRGGTLRDGVSYTSTYSGTGQNLITGLTAGSWTVTVGGSPVSGSPFTVHDEDNSLYFESSAGATVATLVGAACSITTSSLPDGTAGSAYSQTLTSANCSSPLTWSVTVGSLCSGLSLNSGTGAITGTPAGAGSCSFTVSLTDNAAATDTQALTITVQSAGGGATQPRIFAGNGTVTGNGRVQ